MDIKLLTNLKGSSIFIRQYDNLNMHGYFKEIN